RSLANKTTGQPLRSIMWLPDKKGLLGMMPGYATDYGVMGIKVISVFHGNRQKALPSHQGVVMILDSNNGTPLMLFDAKEITSIRTAAASAVATKLLSNENAACLAIIGSGEQAERHIEAVCEVRNVRQINLWSRNQQNAQNLANKLKTKYSASFKVFSNPADAAKEADIICTVTSSTQPVISFDWIKAGAHINAIGACTPNAQEIDSATMVNARLYCDCYDSIYNEPGDFLIPFKQGLITKENVIGEIGEVIIGTKPGRQSFSDITLYKSLGIAAEDIFSAFHIYHKLKPDC
ncbi:MAG: ornithine cyclodeaminase family protein, partial [Sphingobacteriales bacterium]|nr:ornithine cyclodeaminase family protein [Sphingobacteriales bacterium]